MGEVGGSPHLHDVSSADTAWSRVNTVEAIPDIPTPLSWSVWRGSIDATFRQGYGRLGLLPGQVRRAQPQTADDSFSAIFYGRPANNLSLVRAALAQLPSSGATERDFYSSAGSDPSSPELSGMSFYLGARLGFICAAPTLRRRQLHRRADSFWRDALAGLAAGDAATAREAFNTAMQVMAHGCADQCVWSTRLSLTQSRLQQLLATIGRKDLALGLLGGYSGGEELAWATALWDVANDRMTVNGFLYLYGFHGPNESELKACVWREDSGPLEAMISRVRSGADPHVLAEQGRAAHHDAAVSALASCRGWTRFRLRSTLRRYRQLAPLRGVCKVAYMKAFDVARAAARVIGSDLVANNKIDEVSEVFYLTATELSDPPTDARQVIAQRKEEESAYRGIDLPLQWVGNPVVVTASRPSSDGPYGDGGSVSPPGSGEPTLLTGLGASAGIAVGKARVVTDPSSQILEQDEVLVCHTTDPSWASLFVLASAVVIDIGSVLSHGAIIARELGRPCVINTVTGTRCIATGDVLRVDGNHGTVETLSRTD